MQREGLLMLLPTSIFLLLFAVPLHAVSLGRGPDHRSRHLLEHSARASLDEQSAESMTAVKADFPFYHTTDELTSKVEHLQSNCHGAMSVQREEEDGVQIDIISVRKPDSQPVNKVFFLFGEHSRELISPESGLELLHVLCGARSGNGLADVLDDSEFQMVVNGNPRSRMEVEDGNYCLRTNPSGVDLNRNWDEKWTGADAESPASTNPGPHPFSEPETRIFKKAVSAFKPTTFVTIHSGTEGMYMPWAYDTLHIGKFNQENMMKVLTSVDEAHCECPFGAAGREVGYACPGTCLDWVYENLRPHTKYVFAFEIFASPELSAGLRERWREQMQEMKEADTASLLEQGAVHLANESFHSFFRQHPSDFIDLSSNTRDSHADAEQAACFRSFNPTVKDDYMEVVDNWVSAYIDMSKLIAEQLKGDVKSDTV